MLRASESVRAGSGAAPSGGMARRAPPACGGLCRLKPAFQAGGAVGAVERCAVRGAEHLLRARAGVLERCAVRGAEHRACRSGDRRSRPVAPSGRWSGAPCAVRSTARAGLETGVPGRWRRRGGGAVRRARCGAPACRSGDRRSRPVAPSGRWSGAPCAVRSTVPVWRPAFQPVAPSGRWSVATCAVRSTARAGLETGRRSRCQRSRSASFLSSSRRRSSVAASRSWRAS